MASISGLADGSATQPAGDARRAALVSAERLARRLADGPPLLLDGALGTELEARGVGCELPLWSARALLDEPDAVRQIHAAYAAAGAELLTADTFRTQARTLARAEAGQRDGELSALAVDLAREAAGPGVWVAASVAPLEDCYQPRDVPDDATLAREHSRHAEVLAAAAPDLFLIETMNCVREARAACRAAADVAQPFWTSFVCDGEARLLSGESLEAGLEAAATLGARAVLVNCLPPGAADRCLPALRRSGLPFGLYPNLGAPTPVAAGSGRPARTDWLEPAAFALACRRWTEAGARVVGGCCGTTPAHIRALAASLPRPSPPGAL